MVRCRASLSLTERTRSNLSATERFEADGRVLKQDGSEGAVGVG